MWISQFVPCIKFYNLIKKLFNNVFCFQTVPTYQLYTLSSMANLVFKIWVHRKVICYNIFLENRILFKRLRPISWKYSFRKICTYLHSILINVYIKYSNSQRNNMFQYAIILILQHIFHYVMYINDAVSITFSEFALVIKHYVISITNIVIKHY